MKDNSLAIHVVKTLLQPQTLAKILVRRPKSWVSTGSKRHHNSIVESAIYTSVWIPIPSDTYQRCFIILGIWIHHHSIATTTSAQILLSQPKSWVIISTGSKLHNNFMVETVNHFRMYPTSPLYI
jgi:hypothetical protein